MDDASTGPGGPQRDDQLAAAVSGARSAISRVRTRLAELEDALRAATDAGAAGDEPALVERLFDAGAPDLRRDVTAALLDYEHATRRIRAEAVRTFVDAGMTLTAAAKRMGVSRPMAARLYRSIADPSGRTGRRAGK